MNRRRFLERIAAVPVASVALAGGSVESHAQGGSSPGGGRRFVGIQMGPHTLLDEGIEPCFDLIQRTAGVNAVLTYSHAFHGDLRKPARLLAADHGKPPRENRPPLPSVWVRHHDRYFTDTTLRVKPPDPALEYAGRDVFAEMLAPARRRGMKVYARILEGSGASITNFSSVVTVDVYGKPTRIGCWNNPQYRAFWRAVVEDLFRSYDLDGFQWGAERMGPLMNVILPWNDGAPTCFCEYCRARGRAKGIDVERARTGFEELYVYVRGLMSGKPRLADGVFTGFVRILLRYPEVLAWEYQYRLSREEVMRSMYEKIKSVKPSAEVGWHVDHQPSSWDLVYRAELSYEDMAPYSDFIKFIAYHDVLGPRIRWWYLDRFQKTILGELSLDESLNLYYNLFGYDKNAEPAVDELEAKGLSPDYVYRETKRSVASAAGKTKIYTGIGFDVPWGSNTIPGDPDEISSAVTRAFDAGASGIVISREYEEMRLRNLQAVGAALTARAG
ncbi:MAG: hypothetical protein A3H96_02610 [Acidobacteria bacterium RIFCSPLOWO2_02_FULL_67_36]|nr:MAG: hypothetical protein A3H96_02610 [Acidobacteria bacterium RIFCSPLOWO2_02_FULL_67_36]OFW26123.1 MAG: hypothetical protein A3G21_23930 [Acidobacteria bacterium RIFCSPLOWO2_12_FULL_66_21]